MTMTMTCTKLTLWTLFAIALQIGGLTLFVMGFFPMKPALSGVSGPESYLPPGNHSFDDFNVTHLSPDQLRSLYLELSQIPPSYSRLILMVVDGLPAEFVLGKDGRPPSRTYLDAMPYTQSLLGNGMAIGYHSKAASPTVTMPRLKAMVSGAIGGFLDVAFNFNTQAFLDDNLLAQFYRIGWKMLMFGDETWLKLFPKYFSRQDGVSSFFVKDTVQVDQNVSRHLPEELNQDDWHLMILHYLGLDHVGHVGGRKSSFMGPKLREMDDIIKMIHMHSILGHERKQGETLLLVVSDHGMTDNGNHGGSSYEETDSLALLIGPSFKMPREVSRIYGSVNQVDLAPMLALLYGVPIPINNVGVLAADFLQTLTDTQQLRAMELNSWQLLRLLKAQLPGLRCADSYFNGPGFDEWANINQCAGSVETMFCCLYSKATIRHHLWKSVSRSDDGNQYNHTLNAYFDFMTTASEWLTCKVTDRPFHQLAFGIVAMLLSCVIFLRLLFCLRREDCLKEPEGSSGSQKSMHSWSLEENFVVAEIVVVVISMASSSMVEEEQYIWHFMNTTLLWIFFRNTISFIPLGQRDIKFEGLSKSKSRKAQVSMILAILVSGRIIRGWHQGGVNWTHLPDISKWLEGAGNFWIKMFQVVSGIILTTWSLFVFSSSRLNKGCILLLKFLFLLSGCLVLLHIMNYQDSVFLDSGHGATLNAQMIYSVLGISVCLTGLCSPWISPILLCGETGYKIQSSCSEYVKGSQFHPVAVCGEISYVIGWAYILSWSLLQLLLQQPINSMPVFLLLLQISATMIYFSIERKGRKAWVEVAALYSLGLAGHFGLGNTNTLATIDVAGAFIGISSHSTLLSGILMFCITYASPLLVLISLVLYISFKAVNHSRMDESMEFGLQLKSVLGIPLLVPLCINSVLLIAYTIVLLQMRNHLFIWSVFSPKYLYVCASTVCVYVGVCIVAATETYILSVCHFRSRRLAFVKST